MICLDTFGSEDNGELKNVFLVLYAHSSKVNQIYKYEEWSQLRLLEICCDQLHSLISSSLLPSSMHARLAEEEGAMPSLQMFSNLQYSLLFKTDIDLATVYTETDFSMNENEHGQSLFPSPAKISLTPTTD